MSKQAMREETERLIREAMAKKTITIKQGATRIEATCGKCGAEKPRVGGERRIPRPIHLQGMWAQAKVAVTPMTLTRDRP